MKSIRSAHLLKNSDAGNSRRGTFVAILLFIILYWQRAVAGGVEKEEIFLRKLKIYFPERRRLAAL
jgi:hypothetical protein